MKNPNWILILNALKKRPMRRKELSVVCGMTTDIANDCLREMKEKQNLVDFGDYGWFLVGEEYLKYHYQRGVKYAVKECIKIAEGFHWTETDEGGQAIADAIRKHFRLEVKKQ